MAQALKQTESITANSEFHAESILLRDSLSIQDEWMELAKNAIEPNPFYEPAYLLSVQEHLLSDETQHLVLIRTNSEDRRLIGLFPISVRGPSHWFPYPVTNFTFDSLLGVCTPLIADPHPEQVWQSFLNFLDQHPDFPAITYITEFYSKSPCGEALTKACGTGNFLQQAEHEFDRSIARCNGSFEDYKAQWSTKKARNIRSRRKKLDALGTLAFENLTPDDALFLPNLQSILDLEAAGWKGKKGTALACESNTLAFAKQAFGASNFKPTIHLAIMRLDDRIIAGQINLVSQNRAFFLKSAYDEELSKFGPGVILYSWVQEQAFDHGLYSELDSCADANHSLEEIWLERERVQGLFVAMSSNKNKSKISSMITMRKFINALRSKAKMIAGKLSK